jgi:hypothetical protein
MSAVATYSFILSCCAYKIQGAVGVSLTSHAVRKAAKLTVPTTLYYPVFQFPDSL